MQAQANEMPASSPQRFLRLFLLGLVGVAGLPFAVMPMLQLHALPMDAPPASLPALLLLSLVQPVLLLTLGVAIGGAVAHRVGLRSLVADWAPDGPSVLSRLRAATPLALALGLAVAAITLALDILFFKPLLPEFFDHAQTVQPHAVETTLSGLLYGGITEELIMRWGIMSLLVWLAWRWIQRDGKMPRPALVWSGIVLSAALFALLHLPAAGAIAPLTFLSVSRILLLNGIAGIAFGWLFWRRGLEAGMISHASVHVFLFLAVLAGLG